MLQLFEGYLDRKDVADEARYDKVREGAIVFLGTLARHLDPSDSKVCTSAAVQLAHCSSEVTAAIGLALSYTHVTISQAQNVRACDPQCLIVTSVNNTGACQSTVCFGGRQRQALIPLLSQGIGTRAASAHVGNNDHNKVTAATACLCANHRIQSILLHRAGPVHCWNAAGGSADPFLLSTGSGVRLSGASDVRLGLRQGLCSVSCPAPARCHPIRPRLPSQVAYFCSCLVCCGWASPHMPSHC